MVAKQSCCGTEYFGPAVAFPEHKLNRVQPKQIAKPAEQHVWDPKCGLNSRGPKSRFNITQGSTCFGQKCGIVDYGFYEDNRFE